METIKDLMTLNAKRITTVDTVKGYMHVLEYILQDRSFLHVVQWHYNNILHEDSRLPIVNNKTIFRDRENAMKFAEVIGNDLLKTE